MKYNTKTGMTETDEANLKDMRKEYLLDRLVWLRFEVYCDEQEIEQLLGKYKARLENGNNYIDRVLLLPRIDSLKKRIKRFRAEIDFLKGRGRKKVTHEMIEKAKDYPIADIIQVHNNKALCVFHDEKNPSMGIKHNRYNCFACGERGDVIDLVMKTKNLAFLEAVKFLNQ